MAVNKVVYGNNTLIDLTEDTVSADKLLAGETAHDRSGAPVVGSVVTAEVVDNLTTQDATKALSANQGYVLNQSKVDNTASEIQTSDGQFTTVTGGLMQSCVVDLEPIQNLHGYSKPWTGGSGKNKLPNNATTQTINGITWTVEKDADGNVIGVDANGTATAESNFYFYGSQTLQPLGQIANGMILSGCPSGGGANSYYIVAGSLSSRYATDSGYSDTLSNVLQDGIRVICRIINGYTANHVKFRPMIRQSGQSADFEPYTNICPIEGHWWVTVDRVGKNKLNVDDAEIGTAWNGTSNSARARLVIPCNPSKTYMLSMNGTNGLDGVYYEPSASIPPSGITRVTFPQQITTRSTDKYITLGFNKDSISKADIEALKLQLEEGSQATDYEPYQGIEVITNLGGQKYGGKLDVISGVLTVTHGFYSNTWGNGSSATNLGSVTRKTYDFTSAGLSKNEATTSRMNCADYLNSWAENSTHYTINASSHKDLYLFLPNGTSSDFAFQLCFELATPTTIQLDPQTLETLVGQNDVFAPLDGQTVEEVEYREVLAWDDASKAFEHEWFEVCSGTVTLNGVGGSSSQVQLSHGENMSLDSSKAYEIKVMVNLPGIEVYTDILPYPYPMNIIFSPHSKSESTMVAKYKLMAREIGGTSFFEDTFYEASMVKLESL